MKKNLKYACRQYLSSKFFAKPASKLAIALLGKVIYVKYRDIWLTAQIIETEAYYLEEKASHASLGYTPKRKALFMPPGTIYMYYARGGDSLNISAEGEGNAVLVKSAIPYVDKTTSAEMIEVMQAFNPTRQGQQRVTEKLCAGQTLLCKSLGLKVVCWDQKKFCRDRFYIADVGYKPGSIIQTTRLGIPLGRDEHLPYRYIDVAYACYCTSNPLAKRQFRENEHYWIINMDFHYDKSGNAVSGEIHF